MSALTGGRVSVPEGSVKIEVRKENLLSNGTAGARGPGAGQPLPSRRAGDAGTPRGRSQAGINPAGAPGTAGSARRWLGATIPLVPGHKWPISPGWGRARPGLSRGCPGARAVPACPAPGQGSP